MSDNMLGGWYTDYKDACKVLDSIRRLRKGFSAYHEIGQNVHQFVACDGRTSVYLRSVIRTWGKKASIEALKELDAHMARMKAL